VSYVDFTNLPIRIEKRNLSNLNDWIAENQSSEPALFASFEWFPRVTTALEAQMAIFLSLYIPVWTSDRLIDHIAQQAYRYNYSGTWKTVQALLESYHTPASFLSTYLESHTEDEFFGNFLLSCNRYIRWNKRALREMKQRGIIRRKVRKRGYDDKGSLRPEHQKGRNLPSPFQKEDRRSLNNHPLSKFLGEDVANFLILAKKEVNNCASPRGKEEKSE